MAVKAEQYIWISRWEEFQHYAPRRDRGPAWIKNHTAQLDDERYLDLTDRQRALLTDLRMLFATYRGRLRYDQHTITARRNSRTRYDDLQALNHAGFIQPVSREVLEARLENLYASRAPARSQEAEAEKELKEAERSEITPNSNGLPISHELKVMKLLQWIGSHADQDTPDVLRAFAHRSSEAALARVMESARGKNPGNRAGYVISALKSELEEATA